MSRGMDILPMSRITGPKPVPHVLLYPNPATVARSGGVGYTIAVAGEI